WTGEEQLPLDFCDKLRERLGADAIVFVRLTQYRAYAPLTVGWRIKLLETDEPRILWAVDEVFDARVPGVAAAARPFARDPPHAGSLSPETDDVLPSPRRFGQSTASAVVAPLPAREPGRKTE